MAGYDPTLAALAALGATFAFVLIVNLPIAVALFCSEPLNLSVEDSTVVRMAAILMVVVWAGYMFAQSGRRQASLGEHPLIVAAAGLFFVWAVCSLAWADYTPDALRSVGKYSIAVLLIPIVFTTVRKGDTAVLVAAVFVCGATLSVLSSLADGGGGTRLSGEFLDPNILAATLVSSTAISFGLAAGVFRSQALRSLAFLACLLSLLGIMLTVSRGGIVALLIMGLAAIAIAGRWRKRMVVITLSILTLTAFYTLALAPPESRDRILQTNPGSAAQSEARSTIWQVGWRMAEANPVGGVGTGNYAPSLVHYLLQPGLLTNTTEVVNTPKMAHNIYLEWLAELGVVGLTLMLLLIGAVIRAYWRAADTFAGTGDQRLELLTRALAVALIGYLVASAFVSLEYNKLLWLLLGMGPAMFGIARTTVESDQAEA